jgi:hypothetical protein
MPLAYSESIAPFHPLFIQMTLVLFITTIIGGRGGWGYHVHVSEKHVAVKMFDYI